MCRQLGPCGRHPGSPPLVCAAGPWNDVAHEDPSVQHMLAKLLHMT